MSQSQPADPDRFYRNRQEDVAPLSHPPDRAARRLGVSRSRVFELMKAGELKSFLIGGRRYIADSELAAFVERCSASSAADGA